jgi:hypothetical protein
MNAELQQRLAPMARVITEQLACKPEHFITHPSEMKLFHSLGESDLRAFARTHGWRVVRRVGGRRIEFYNDAHEQMERARTGNISPADERAPR